VPWGLASLLARDRVLDHPEHPEAVRLAHLGARLDAHFVAQTWESWADNFDPEVFQNRRSTGSVRTLLGCPIGLSEQTNQVPVATPKGTRRTDTDIRGRSHVATSTGALTAVNWLGSGRSLPR